MLALRPAACSTFVHPFAPGPAMWRTVFVAMVFVATVFVATVFVATVSGADDVGRVSQDTLRVGDTLYLSAQPGLDPAGANPPTEMGAATRLAMRRLQRALAAEGLDFSDVVSAQVWLTDLGKYGAMNSAYRTFFAKRFPTRTTLGVAALPGGALVQIAMVAFAGPKRVIRPADAKASDLPFSPGILAGDTLYLSGHVGVDPATGQLIEGGVADHVKQTLQNIGEVLKAAQMDFSHVVSSYLYLQNPDAFGIASQAYLTRINQEPRPARMPMGVAALPLGSPVEITMIASRKVRQERRGKDQPPSGAYSRGLLNDDVMHLAGVFRREGTLSSQVDSCIAWIEPILQAGGMGLGDVVEVRIYLAEIQDFPEVADAYRRHFSDAPPTLAVIAVPKLPAKSRIMMGLVASQSKRGNGRPSAD
ncbi:MAG: hypothetical protein CMJ59_05680 [Planctomycetaceae bacterium]|nr:hypothetical protein [Planctomycetaceae bacterium]